MRALGAIFVGLGLFIAVMAPHFANIENDMRHRVRMQVIAAYGRPSPVLDDVSAWPQALIGGGTAALGILVLAIRRPEARPRKGQASCEACSSPAQPGRRLCARCSG
jgi:hypothetical protein